MFIGGESTPSRAIVRNTDHAYRLKSQLLKDEFNRHGDLLLLMLRYIQSLITQMAQTAVCNRHHYLGRAVDQDSDSDLLARLNYC